MKVLNPDLVAGLSFYTMPFVEGESLRGRLARGPVPLSESGVALAMDSTRSDIFLQVGEVQLVRGRPDGARAAFEAAERLGSGFAMPAFLSVAARKLGQASRADSLYRALLERYRTDRSLGYAVAVAAAGAGDLDRAMAAVAESIKRRSLFLSEISLPCDPIFDALKGDPRFARLLTGAGLLRAPGPWPAVRSRARHRPTAAGRRRP